MRRYRGSVSLAAAAALTLLPGAIHAQDPAALQRQQMMMSMQEHARQIGEAMRRMESVQERARQMEQQMLREMEQLRIQTQSAQVAERLRQQERLREMAHSMSLGAQEMHRAMEQLRNMLEGPGGPLGQEMEQEVARLRNHWELMVGSMEEGLRLLERLRDRVQASAPSGG